MSPPPAYRGLHVYYGDLHNHCNISYGHGDLEEAYANARPEVVALCEVFAPRAAEARSFLEEQYRQAGHPLEIAVYDELDACLADPRVELVMVTTHSDQHREPVERAPSGVNNVYRPLT